MEFNSVNSVHSAGLPDGSKKLQRGDTGGDPNQMMLFASLIGPASAITPREAENNNLDAEYAKDVGGKSSIENVLKHSGLKGKENIVEHGKAGVKELTDHKMEILHKEISSKGVVSESLKSGLTRAVAGKKDALGVVSESLKSGLTRAVAGKGDASGVVSESLKSGLTRAVAGKAETFKKSRGEIAKDVGGKTSIENILKHSGLKGKENIVEHGKTGIKELTDYKIEVLQKEISSSTRLVDKISPVGEYHHTDFHTAGRTTAVNESVKNYGMEPRTLINQIVNGVSKTGRVKIVLTPPHLGTLDMEVLVKNNKVHIILQTENNNVKHILQSNVETLKSALRSQGLIADNINVFVQERSDSAGYSGFGRNETLFKEGNNQNKNGKDQGGRWDALDHTPSLFDEENPSVRVDGRISLFV